MDIYVFFQENVNIKTKWTTMAKFHTFSNIFFTYKYFC